MAAVLAAAPSWNVTIGICAVLFPIAAWALAGLVRDLGEDGRRTSHPPLPLIVFAGIPVAVLTAVFFVGVARRDDRIDGNEAAVLCAGTGAIVLLIAIDLIRAARRERATAQR
jgi:hypothetical protein